MARDSLPANILAQDVPDDITIEQFMNDERYGRLPFAKSRNPYTCGITGKTFTGEEVKQRTNYMARAISKRLGFLPNEGTEWHKVICLHSLNTVSCNVHIPTLPRGP